MFSSVVRSAATSPERWLLDLCERPVFVGIKRTAWWDCLQTLAELLSDLDSSAQTQILGTWRRGKKQKQSKYKDQLDGARLVCVLSTWLDHLPAALQQVVNSLSFISFVFKIDNYCTAGQWLESESNRKNKYI